jgi:hypothetical protein
LTCTTELGTKVPPVTVTVSGAVLPTVNTEGLSWIDPTGGLSTVRAVDAEVPPPGLAFTAVSERLPVAAKSAAVNATLTWVALAKVVVRAAPLTSIAVVGTNPVPVTVILRELVPSNSAEGDRDEITGNGLSTSRLTGVAVPLLTDPFITITANSAPLAN